MRRLRVRAWGGRPAGADSLRWHTGWCPPYGGPQSVLFVPSFSCSPLLCGADSFYPLLCGADSFYPIVCGAHSFSHLLCGADSSSPLFCGADSFYPLLCGGLQYRAAQRLVPSFSFSPLLYGRPQYWGLPSRASYLTVSPAAKPRPCAFDRRVSRSLRLLRLSGPLAIRGGHCHHHTILCMC